MLVIKINKLKGARSMSRRCPEPRWFIGDTTSLARNNIYLCILLPIHGAIDDFWSKSNLAYYGLGNVMFQKWNIVHIQVHFWVIFRG